MNTLYLYEDDVSEKIARMVSPMVGMGACASYKSPRPWQHYGQVVLILGERGSLLSSLGEWREALSRKSVILVAAVKTDADWKEGLRAVEEGLGRSLTASFRLSRENFLEDAIEAARHIKALRPEPLADEEALQAMEDFLVRHNTGVLTTGSDGILRATPIDYVFVQQKLYFFSEGGEKFIHLYRNPQAAFAVFDSFTDVRHLGGLQIEGSVRLLEGDDPAYVTAAAAKGISQKRLDSLAVTLHGIELTPRRLTFVWSGFAERKQPLRQIYYLS